MTREVPVEHSAVKKAVKIKQVLPLVSLTAEKVAQSPP